MEHVCRHLALLVADQLIPGLHQLEQHHMAADHHIQAALALGVSQHAQLEQPCSLMDHACSLAARAHMAVTHRQVVTQPMITCLSASNQTSNL